MPYTNTDSNMTINQNSDINVHEENIQENIQQLSTITYEFNNTVGPKSISKQELIFKFNPLLN